MNRAHKQPIGRNERNHGRRQADLVGKQTQSTENE